MISAQVKVLVGTRWQLLEIQRIKGESIVSYMTKTPERVVAALMEDGVPRVFLVNRKEDYAVYKPKGPTFYPAEIRLLSDEVIEPWVAGVFPDGSFVELVRSFVELPEDGKTGAKGD